ncbi:MAG TPA: response regulator [Leptolyngbyaceae cyanobacterium]
MEDNQDDKELTLMAFEQSGINSEVEVVRDGAEALDYLFGTGNHAEPDISNKPAAILLDLKLPKISGLEVLRRLRKDEQTHYLPIVVLSTSKEDRDIINSYKLGCNSYVRKPVDFNEFLTATQQLGLYWLSLNETLPD